MITRVINVNMDNLKSLTTKELQSKWQEIFKTPAPKGYTKSYLIKELDWYYQYNKLPSKLQNQINYLVENYEKTKTVNVKKIKKFNVAIGTKFIREFKGEKYEVIAVDGGFNFNGKLYKTLSAVANVITGTHWNGKIAASKKKGMWMGGRPPIGYKKENKKLIVEEKDAQKVQMLFEKYLELKSVPKLMQYLKENKIKTKTDKYFSKGQLYHLLANKVYIGKITHKDKVYDGEHEAIISEGIFKEIQKLLYENKVDKTCGTKCSSNSLLAGLIFDDKNNLMTPSHSNSHKRRYRYYVSTALKNYNDNEVGTISKIPAGEVEKFVVETTKEFLQDKKQIQKIVSEYKISKQNKLIYIAQDIQDYSEPKLIRAIIHKIMVSKNLIEITYNETSIKKVLNALANNQEIVVPDKN